MLTEREKKFVTHWEKVRLQESSFQHKLLAGLPFAMLFSMPILLFLISVYFFLPDWYAKVSGAGTSSMPAIILAVVLITFFFSYFRMHFKWEMSEQLYLELKQKHKATEDGASLPY